MFGKINASLIIKFHLFYRYLCFILQTESFDLCSENLMSTLVPVISLKKGLHCPTKLGPQIIPFFGQLLTYFFNISFSIKYQLPFTTVSSYAFIFITLIEVYYIYCCFIVMLIYIIMHLYENIFKWLHKDILGYCIKSMFKKFFKF